MRKSSRRIGNTLLVLAIFGLTLGSVGSLSFQCGTDAQGCIAALFSFTGSSVLYVTPDLTTAQSTAAFPIDGVGWWPFVQIVSGYTLLIAVLILIVLEAFELHYIRKIIQYRKLFRIV